MIAVTMMCSAISFLSAGHGRAHAAEQRKERESLEEIIHSIQLESELTSRALKQSVAVSLACDQKQLQGQTAVAATFVESVCMRCALLTGTCILQQTSDPHCSSHMLCWLSTMCMCLYIDGEQGSIYQHMRCA